MATNKMSKPNSIAYADALKAASDMAIAEFDEVLSKLDLSKPYECKKVLLVVVPAIVEKYGAMAAAAAAEYYADERAVVIGGDYKPLIAPPVEKEVIRMKVRYALRYLFGDDADDD